MQYHSGRESSEGDVDFATENRPRHNDTRKIQAYSTIQRNIYFSKLYLKKDYKMFFKNYFVISYLKKGILLLLQIIVNGYIASNVKLTVIRLAIRNISIYKVFTNFK